MSVGLGKDLCEQNVHPLYLPGVSATWVALTNPLVKSLCSWLKYGWGREVGG